MTHPVQLRQQQAKQIPQEVPAARPLRRMRRHPRLLLGDQVIAVVLREIFVFYPSITITTIVINSNSSRLRLPLIDQRKFVFVAQGNCVLFRPSLLLLKLVFSRLHS